MEGGEIVSREMARDEELNGSEVEPIAVVTAMVAGKWKRKARGEKMWPDVWHGQAVALDGLPVAD